MKKIKKLKARIVARLQPSVKPFVIKMVEIEVMIVDKVILNALVDRGSGLNIMSIKIIEKLGLG